MYNHILGDGREFVITDNTALKVRAEDGRVIHKDDISLFIDNLPNGKIQRNLLVKMQVEVPLKQLILLKV